MGFIDWLSVFVWDYLWGMPLVILLMATAVVTMIASDFFPLRYFGRIMKKAWNNIFKSKENESKGSGILNQLQATSMALGTTIGVGNISGVATAIAVGGPGAVFWMWMSALFGMALKMAEITLALYYRQKNDDGETYGSPLYYMEKGVGTKKGLKGISIALITIMCIGALTTFVINIQTYTVAEAIGTTFNIGFIPIAIVYTILMYLMIGGGVKSLGKISGILVPIMCIFYIVVGIIIILLNIGQVPAMLAYIVKSAFTGSAAVGGFMGATVVAAMKTGVSRAVFSNEAGWGTAPTIHASAKVDHPVKQGIMGVFEVFVDTFIVCTVTSLVILLSGEWSNGLDGANLTLTAYEQVIGTPGRILLAISIFIFGLTTSSGVFAQLETYFRFFVDKYHFKGSKVVMALQKWLYPLPALIMVIIAVKLGYPGTTLWLLSDLTTAVPIFANCITILILMPKFRSLVKDYKARYMGKDYEPTLEKPFYDTND